MCRASELFDWLRGLPENHELAHLCDVYTYTTIISQCGSHQQLRKALELVAEMRGHGVMCNVHTYSALMNVCIKVSFHNDIWHSLIRLWCLQLFVLLLSYEQMLRLECGLSKTDCSQITVQRCIIVSAGQ